MEEKGQVTVVVCGNNAGQRIPPMIVYDAKKLCHAWTISEVPGTSYGLSDKGWINVASSRDVPFHQLQQLQYLHHGQKLLLFSFVLHSFLL